MLRLCFGTIMTILYQARSHKVTNKSICDALFACFGKSAESYDSSTPGHLKSGKINVPPDVIDAARKSNADELDAAVQKNIIPLIKISQHEAIVRSLKDIIRNDSAIMDSTRIGYCAGYEKQSILEGDVFCLSSLLASVIYYVCVEVKNSDCAEAIKSISGEYVKGFEAIIILISNTNTCSAFAEQNKVDQHVSRHLQMRRNSRYITCKGDFPFLFKFKCNH